MSSRSNAERARWRQKCREALAEHINLATKLTVLPAEVRLRPKPGDGYRWLVARSGRRLFQKKLSKLSVGVYARLMKEAGQTFRAVGIRQRRNGSADGEREGDSGGDDDDDDTLEVGPTVVKVSDDEAKARGKVDALAEPSSSSSSSSSSLSSSSSSPRERIAASAEDLLLQAKAREERAERERLEHGRRMTITMHALVERHKALAAKLRDRDATIQYYRARLKARDAKMKRVLTLVREVGCVLVTLEVGACRSKSCSS